MVAAPQYIHSIGSLREKGPHETSFRYHLAKLRTDDLVITNTAIKFSALSSLSTPGNTNIFASRRMRNASSGTGSRCRSMTSVCMSPSLRFHKVARVPRRSIPLRRVPRKSKKTPGAWTKSRPAEPGSVWTGEFAARKVIELLTIVQVSLILPVRQYHSGAAKKLDRTQARFGEYITSRKPGLDLMIAVGVELHVKGQQENMET